MHLLLFFAGRSGIDSRDSTGDVGGTVLFDDVLTNGVVEQDGRWHGGTILHNNYLTGIVEDTYRVKYRGASHVGFRLGIYTLGEKKLGT